MAIVQSAILVVRRASQTVQPSATDKRSVIQTPTTTPPARPAHVSGQLSPD